MEQREALDIILSAVVLAFVFAWRGFDRLTDLPFLFVISVVTVSVSFILHELGHRWLARRYGAYAEFRKWNFGLALALLLAFVTNGGFVFAAPGAVVIHPRYDLWGRARGLTRKSLGLIGGIGPAINIALGLGFLAAYLLTPISIFLLGVTINAWLGLFNMLPIPPLDGSKVWMWDKRAWAAIFVASGALLYVGFFF